MNLRRFIEQEDTEVDNLFNYYKNRNSVPYFIGNDFGDAVFNQLKKQRVHVFSGVDEEQLDKIGARMADAYNLGIEGGAKGFVLAGENQFFIDRETGKILPFSRMDEIETSPNTVPKIKKFLNQQATNQMVEMDRELNELMPSVHKYIDIQMNHTKNLIDGHTKTVTEYEKELSKALKKSSKTNSKTEINEITKKIESKKKELATLSGSFKHYEFLKSPDNTDAKKYNVVSEALFNKILKTATELGFKTKTTPTIRNSIEKEIKKNSPSSEKIAQMNTLKLYLNHYDNLEKAKELELVKNYKKKNFIDGIDQDISPTYLHSYLSEFKKGDTSTLITDYFTITNVNEIRKNLVKGHDWQVDSIIDNFYKMADYKITDFSTITNLESSPKNYETWADLLDLKMPNWDEYHASQKKELIKILGKTDK